MPAMKDRPFNIAPLTDRQLRDAKLDKVYVYNVSPIEHVIPVDGRRFVIPARAEGSRVSEPVMMPESRTPGIDGVVYTTAWRENALVWDARDGIDVAGELAGTKGFLHPSQNLTSKGVFIAQGGFPTDDEIEKAMSLWLEDCNRLVMDGDALAEFNNGQVDIGNGRRASNIGSQHRIALKELGLSRPWAAKNIRMVECEQCGTSNLPKAAMCKSCEAVFDEEAARRLFPQKFNRGPGRPRAEATVTQ